jgi:amyloid beta precursor protein binding protein 1
MATKNKYDRQLRLWGANGQKALAESCIILINATSAGTESLKNLVLPGIGSFHIIDDQMVDATSTSTKPFSNFFVFPDSEQKTTMSRAEIATKHLLELNPDVTGSFTSVPSLEDANYGEIIQSIQKSNGDGSGDGHSHDNFLIIAADLPSKILKSISNYCWNGGNDGGKNNNNNAIPLVIVKSYGLLGTVRLQTPLHTIIESKPDNSIPDMRLASIATPSSSHTFPELLEFVQSIDLSKLENHIHGHVPFVIILFKAMEKWLNGTDIDTDTTATTATSGKKQQPPKTFSEKQEFKKMIQSMSRNYHMELNFQEAVDNASLVYTTLDIPCEVEELLHVAEENLKNKLNGVEGSDNGSENENTGGSLVTSFDILLVALKRFMDNNNGYPPLNGSIPDMTASTTYYIQLQNIYKTKAQKDEDEMKTIIQSIHDESNDVLPKVSDDELSIFCKNVYNLRLTKTRSYTSEYDFVYSSQEQKDKIQGELVAETFDPFSAPAQTPLLWFIALRAADAFHDEYGYYPGKDSRLLSLESDAKIVQEKLKLIVEEMGLTENELVTSTIFSTDEEMENAFAKEITRYYNAEIHNISSVVGGVASQEAVKLITKQYVPMNGTYVYNGIAGVAGVYQF